MEPSAEIATSFYSTKLDHYPLDAKLIRPVKPDEPVRPEEPDWPVRPERPERPAFDQEAYLLRGQAYLDEYQQHLETQEAAYQYALTEHELLLKDLEQYYAAELAAYDHSLEYYKDELDNYMVLLTQYEAGECCWEMVKRESEVASRDDVLAMLRENAFEMSLGVDEHGFPSQAVGEITTYATPPVVRLVEGTTREARIATVRAIDNINA